MIFLLLCFNSRACCFVVLLLNFVPIGTKTREKTFTFGEMSVF